MRRPRLLRENIVNLLIELESNGYAKSTLKGISTRLRHLNRICDLEKPELVKRAIADKGCSNTFKQSLVNAYNHYVRFLGLSWVMPSYQREDYEIQVPSEENLNLLIGQATMITAMKLLLMKHACMQPWNNKSRVDTGRHHPGLAQREKEGETIICTRNF